MHIDDAEILTAGQKNFLMRFRDSSLCERYYLTGGTALAAFHVFHRCSEDLDLFAEAEAPIEEIFAFVESLARPEDVLYERKFDRRIFMLRQAGEASLKVEFTKYPFTRLEEGIIVDGIQVDGIRDILTNKIVALTDRRDAKDFVDLYFGMKRRADLDLDLLMADAGRKFGVRGIKQALAGIFLQGAPLLEGLRLREPVSQEALNGYYRQIAAAWIAKSVADVP